MQSTQEIHSKKQPQGLFSNLAKNLFGILKRLKANYNKLAVIRMQGVISSSGSISSSNLISSRELQYLMDKVEKIKNLQAIILIVNSPGGSPVQSELIYRKLRKFAEEKELDIFCFIEDVGASGGYFISCAAKEIYALPSSIIGSIGVISSGFGFVEAIKKLGIERRIYTQGENKAILDPFTPEKEEDIDILKSVQKDIHEHFINIVKDSRKGKIEENNTELFSGKFWSGKEALNLGLIDGINDYETFSKEKFGKDVKFIPVNIPTNWLKRKIGLSTDAIITQILNRIKLEEILQKFQIK